MSLNDSNFKNVLITAIANIEIKNNQIYNKYIYSDINNT